MRLANPDLHLVKQNNNNSGRLFFFVCVCLWLFLTVEGAGGDGKVQQARVGLERGSEHEHARVEAVWPADIGSSWELLACEQVVDVLQHEAVGVEEHALAELCEAPAVQLGECHAQLETLEQGQVDGVVAVQHVDHLDQIKHRSQLISSEF